MFEINAIFGFTATFIFSIRWFSIVESSTQLAHILNPTVSLKIACLSCNHHLELELELGII